MELFQNSIRAVISLAPAQEAASSRGFGHFRRSAGTECQAAPKPPCSCSIYLPAMSELWGLQRYRNGAFAPMELPGRWGSGGYLADLLSHGNFQEGDALRIQRPRPRPGNPQESQPAAIPSKMDKQSRATAARTLLEARWRLQERLPRGSKYLHII